MIKISIIVPFYNVEPYIEQCIRSLYVQDVSVDDYEVICVDDCSPDGSRAIVKRLQKEYPSLQLLSHEYNKRQGGARNTGLRAAKGKYVWFVDSDDYIQPNCFGRLFKIMNDRNEADVYHFDFLRLNFHGKTVLPTIEEDHTYVVGMLYEGEKFVSTAGETWYKQLDGAWRFIIKKSFLFSNKLLFEENVMFEDTDWLFNIFVYAKSVEHYSVAPYIYRENPYSITNKPQNPQKIIWRLLSLLRSSRIIGKASYVEYKNLIERYVSSELSVIGNDIKCFNFINRIKYLLLLKKYELRDILAYCSFRNRIRIKLTI